MIILHLPVRSTIVDDAGVVVEEYTLPAYVPGPYTLPSVPSDRVPSLSWICMRLLAETPEQAGHLGLRLNVHSNTPSDLIPDSTVPLDPRLWITLVQVYDNLPKHLERLQLPLSDIHIPILQRVATTPLFSLLTVLDIPRCKELDDSTIHHLRHLHSLTALDCSATRLSAYGLKVLTGTLTVIDDASLLGRQLSGPWCLRILRLFSCAKINHEVFPLLEKFPLLCVVDLRKTACKPGQHIPVRFRSQCVPNPGFYHPSPLECAVTLLESQTPLFSSPNTFILYINALHHTPSSKDSGTFAGLYYPNSHYEKPRDSTSKRTQNRKLSTPSLPAVEKNLTSSDAAFFYGPVIPRQRYRPRQTSSSAFYSADRHYPISNDWQIATELTNKAMPLMLYCPPPPWSMLDEQRRVSRILDVPKSVNESARPMIGISRRIRAQGAIARLHANAKNALRLDTSTNVVSNIPVSKSALPAAFKGGKRRKTVPQS